MTASASEGTTIWFAFEIILPAFQGSSSWPLWVDATDLCCLRDLMMMMITISKGWGLMTATTYAHCLIKTNADPLSVVANLPLDMMWPVFC